MKVSIVIPTYNRSNILEQCLRSLAVQSFPANEYEVIVVADGCTDGTEELLRSFNPACAFRWLTQPNQGAAVAQNTGVAAAQGEIVIFIDDDIVCGPGLVAGHHDAHARRERVVVLGPVVLHPDLPRDVLRELVGALEDAEYRRLSFEGADSRDMTLCANSSIERQTALRFSFNPSFKRLHDVDAGLRLRAAGYRPHFAPEAIAYDLYSKSVDAFLRDSALLGKYEIILCERYPEFKSWAALGRIREGNPIKRALRRQLAIHASATEPALQAVFSLVNPLRALPPFDWVARRVLNARAGIAHLKGAIEEAGSWEKLEQEFGARRSKSAVSASAR